MITHGAPNRMPGDAWRERGLTIVRWATDAGVDGAQLLGIALGERPIPVPGSTATGEALVGNGNLGADIIRLAAGQGFAPHTHAGDHLIIVVGGQGTITYGGSVYPTRAGEIFLIAGNIPHAVGAITDHVILAIGSPHGAVDAPDRMTPAAYQAILTELDELRCAVCQVVARLPQRLHDVGCPHCPCGACHDRGA